LGKQRTEGRNVAIKKRLRKQLAVRRPKSPIRITDAVEQSKEKIRELARR